MQGDDWGDFVNDGGSFNFSKDKDQDYISDDCDSCYDEEVDEVLDQSGEVDVDHAEEEGHGEDEILNELQIAMKYINPDIDDPFDPDKFDEDTMEFIQPKDRTVEEVAPHILAQIDLLRILLRSGCSLNMYDKIIKWVIHYSKKKVVGNLWTGYPIERRATFINTLSGVCCPFPSLILRLKSCLSLRTQK